MLTDAPAPNWTITPTPGLQVNSTAISDDGSQLITGTSAEYASSSDFAVYSYSTNGGSAFQQWADPLGDNVTQGVFWVAISGDGSHSAAGGEYGSGRGFLRSYNVAAGLASKQEFPTTSRINEVEINSNGQYMVAVEGSSMHFYTLVNGSYSEHVVNLGNVYLRSCGISSDGSMIVIAGESSSSVENNRSRRHRLETSTTTGVFYLYQNVGGQLTFIGSYPTDSGILRAVISRDGAYAAASTKSGTVFCFSTGSYPRALSAMWAYKPDDYSVGLSYALAICHNSAGELFVGVGGNNTSSSAVGDSESAPQYGFSYMLQNVPNGIPGQYLPSRLWIYQLQYCPNPGMNMDAAGSLVTSADGQPIFSATQNAAANSETPGNFYLFDVKSGHLYWQYPTSLMNWAMVINGNGTAVFAGSDDGSVYYWGSTSN